MKPVKTEETNAILKGYGDVADLPITRLRDGDFRMVESCWEVSEEELEIINKTRKVFFICRGDTHPPVLLNANSLAKP